MNRKEYLKLPKITIMEKRRLYIKFIAGTGLILSLGLAQGSAQEALTAAGGNAGGSSGSVSYSVGQVFCSVYSQPEGSINEGVLQPYEITGVTGMDEADDISLDFKAYPNPVAGFLVLKAEYSDIRNLFYQLVDNNGRLLHSEKITCDESIVTMEQYSAGTYFLNIISGDKKVKTFKIIKN